MRLTRTETREKAFMMRIEGRTFAEIAKELGISAKTVSRWENGWTNGAGRRHEGWKKRLDEAWRERLDSQLNYGLMVKEQRLRLYEQLAQMLIAKVKEMLPAIRAKNAAAAKGFLTEIRELLRQLAKEKGDLEPPPEVRPGVKVDLTLEELQKRYALAKADEAERREAFTREAARVRDRDNPAAAMARRTEREDISGEQRDDE